MSLTHPFVEAKFGPWHQRGSTSATPTASDTRSRGRSRRARCSSAKPCSTAAAGSCLGDRGQSPGLLLPHHVRKDLLEDWATDEVHEGMRQGSDSQDERRSRGG
jgi:hypothetical protein